MACVTAFTCHSYNAYPNYKAPVLMHSSNCFRPCTQRATPRRDLSCSSLPESSAVAAAPSPAEKPKPKPKPAAKPLPELMEEEVIPSLKSLLEAPHNQLSQVEISFQDNRQLEGSFLKKGKPYSFWAFFPDGVLTGPKGFSLSSYASEVSTVEPFLVDEKKITARHVVFWVEKRLAAQGIIPVWTQ
ncbi:Protein of unknown function DUF2996 [Dillenia turbinata]|uniref:Uncharacterized protein n=1 Tax=Dillenia turbinata TaxID=194707 RepID=A0AAN8Z5I3_9MAGN